jgi:hypothetical protein
MQESSSPAGADPAAPAPPPPPLPSEPATPSPRRIEWLLLGVAAVLAVVAFSYRGSLGKDTTLDVPITLVTSDRDDLGCAFSSSVGGYRCEAKADGAHWPEPPVPKDRLAPYYSEDRRLFLIPGLFEQPAIAARFREEDPTGRRRESLRRFSARCKLRLVQRADGFKVRWLRDDSWHDSGPAWVAEATDCEITSK